MRIIAFSHTEFIPGEVELLQGILPNVDALHIRKQASINDRSSLANWKQLIQALPAAFRHKIWIHDHYELALDYHLGGMHISRQALSDNAGLGVYAALHSIPASVSCHDLQDGRSFDESYERVFICPLFDSISKPGHNAGFDLGEVKTFLAQDRDAEFIALGGICYENVDTVKELGFDGLAIMGAIWQSADPVEYVKEINQKCRDTQSTY